LTVGWSKSAAVNAAGYQVFYGTASGRYTSVIDAGLNASATLTGLNAGTTYFFMVMVYDANGFTVQFSNEVADTTPGTTEGGPLQILSQPASQTVNAGSTAAFMVGATGAGPIRYEWYLNGAPVSDATTSALSVLASDATAGNYYVVVSNDRGSVTSSNATISVIDPPSVTVQPVSQSVGAGTNVVLRVGMTGTGPFNFQWYCNGAAVPQAQSRAISFSAVAPTNAGVYYVTIQNSAGSVTSATASLTVDGSLFPAVAGLYNGLFYQTNGQSPKVAVATAGLLGNCLVQASGMYSAKLYIDGNAYPVTGTFNGTGDDIEVISRATNDLPALTVVLHADLTGASQIITGTVSSMWTSITWTAPLVADMTSTSATVAAGAWRVIIPPAAGLPNSPQGYAVISVGEGGVATIAGRLYDGSLILQTVPVSNNGLVPMYFTLYGGSGLLEGWVSLSSGTPTGTMTWIRPANANSPIPYPTGFTNVVSVY
jgi:hypothetical protein